MGIESVLIVDDDEKLLAAHRRAVSTDVRVWTAATGAAARSLMTVVRPQVAIVDLRIGDESGLDLIRELRQLSPRTRVVLYSAYLSVATTVAAMREGAEHVLFKPLSLREILKRLEANGHVEPDETPTLARIEWEHISRVLVDCEGNISLAARTLGVHRSSLQRRLRKHAPRT